MIETSQQNIATLAKEALLARLYVPGWSMSGWLKRASKGCTHFEKIAVYREAGKPVGAAIVDDEGLVNVFVRKSFRRKGIGRKLMDALKSDKLEGRYGIQGSLEFFSAVGVYAER